MGCVVREFDETMSSPSDNREGRQIFHPLEYAQKLDHLVRIPLDQQAIDQGSRPREDSEESRGWAAAREAVAPLERRRLGWLRPGPCGGFIIAQPDFGAIESENCAICGATPERLSGAGD